MADPDDLLDGDGDLNDISYDLDCAAEDALLADDNDFTYSAVVTTRHVTFSDSGDIDDDAIELGVEDDLQVPEDTTEEGGVDANYSVVESSVQSSYKNIAEDSDEDEEKRKKERSRFTNERNIGVPTIIKAAPTTIPDSLDKVQVKKSPLTTAGLKSRLRARGGGIRPVRPLNIHVNPHFRTGHPHPHPHPGQHHPPGPPRWDGGYGHPPGYQPSQPYPNQFGPSIRGRAAPPPVWNVPPQGYHPEPPPPYQSPYDDPYYGGGHQGPPHPHPGAPPYHGPHHEPNYYPEHGYHPAQPQGNWAPQGYQGPPQPYPPGPPQGGGHGYGGGPPHPPHPQNFPPRGPVRHPHPHPNPQFQQPRPPQPRPPHPQQGQQGSNLRSRLGPPVKREHPEAIVAKPVKVARIDGAPVQNLVVSVRSNLQTVNTNQIRMAQRKTVHQPVKPIHFRQQQPHIRPMGPQMRGQNFPGSLKGQLQQVKQQIRQGQLPRPRNPPGNQQPRPAQTAPKTQAPPTPPIPQNQNQQAPPKNLFPDAKEEELTAYMKKIEEQKQKRELILKEKEQKRANISAATTTLTRTVSLTSSGQAESQPQLGNEPEMKVVRVKTKDGRIVVRKLPLERISRMKKLGPNGEPIEEKTVMVNNLSASTSRHQILVMAKQVGTIATLELNQDEKRAKIKFNEAKSAKEFITKFQRKMVDLSMINCTLVAD